MRQKLNWQYAEFEVPETAKQNWLQSQQRNIESFKQWENEVAKSDSLFQDIINDKLPKGWDKDLNSLKQKALLEQPCVATRKASEMCLKTIVPNVPEIVGGSADLAASNLTFVEGLKTVTKEDYHGNNIMYGIREHAMGAMMNGMSLHGGIIPYAGTFFVFSDYMRPSMRLAALMGIRVIYVLTHDSIGVGEDGPTHQPIEHLASYRAMPNILTIRPCDVVETAEAWQLAITESKRPSMLVLSRQNLPLLRKECTENLVSKGAYVISPSAGERQATLIATGSEVSIAVNAQQMLAKEGIQVAVVSMPCMELFEEQNTDYKQKVLGNKPIISIEAASTFGWSKYAQKTIGIDTFGSSAPANCLYEHYGITAEHIVAEVKALIK